MTKVDDSYRAYLCYDKSYVVPISYKIGFNGTFMNPKNKCFMIKFYGNDLALYQLSYKGKGRTVSHAGCKRDSFGKARVRLAYKNEGKMYDTVE